jgi:DNA-binding transcriptional MerR regulator
MIRIGDFSKLSRVPVKTLRYYDEVNLLKPVHVDDFTGYRYYAYEQVMRLNRILALKDLGFSLEQIGGLLDEGVSSEKMRGMLILRQSEIRQRVQEEADRLQRVEARLRQIEQEDVMSKYDIVIKSAGAVKVASVREIVPQPSDQGTLWRELGGYLALQRVRPTGACFSLYHDDEYKERDWDIEVCEPVEGELPATQRVSVYSLPPVSNMACVVHHGTFTTIGQAYDAMMKWIGENGYHIVGPAREVYLREAKNGSQTDPDTVTEIQLPVEK